MNEILASEFENVVSYKEGGVDFTANNGLVIVTGHNRDSRISTKTNNGAGKSLLFSMIPNVFWEATPLAKKKNRKNLLEKESFISINFKTPEAEYKVIQKAGAYQIFKNGKDLEVRGIPGQRKKLEELLPLTESEWYSYVYLQSQRPNSFQYGTPRTRLTYITDVWSLENYDRLHKFFTKKVGEVKKAQTEFDVHQETLLGTNDKIADLEWSHAKESKLVEANEIIERLGDRVNELQTIRQDLKVKQHLHEKQVELKAKFKKLKANVKFSKAELKKLYAEIDAYEDYVEANNQYKERKAKYTARLKEIGVVKPKNTREIRKELDKLREIDNKQSRVRDTHDDLVRELENLDDHTEPALRAFMSKHKKTSTDPLAALQDERTQLKSTIQLADLLHDHEDGNCPTCMQSINIKQLEGQVKQARKRLSKVASMIHALEIRNTEIKCKKALQKLNFNESEFYERRKRIKELASQLDAVEDDADKYEEAIEIKAKLESLEKPDPVKKPKYNETELDVHAEGLSELTRIEDQHEDTKDQSSKLKKVEAQLAKIEKRYVKAFKMQSEYSSLKASFDLLNDRREEAMTKLDALQPIIKKLEDYRLLAKAYSASGLKLTATNNILYLLEQTYNQYSGLIFAEAFKFKVFTKKDGVHVQVDRGHGNKSDVSELSGAESDSFALLHFLACLVLAPPNKRMNIAILDEPDSHMDDTTSQIFSDRYLPFLRSLVPHIFLITQKGKHKYTECSYIEVEKRKGVSTVKYE